LFFAYLVLVFNVWVMANAEPGCTWHATAKYHTVILTLPRQIMLVHVMADLDVPTKSPWIRGLGANIWEE